MSAQTFEAPDVTRAVTNVNGFVPAASRFPVVRYELVPGLVVTAADLYVIGQDSADSEFEPSGVPAEIVLSAKDSKDLEKFLRACKRDRVELEIGEIDEIGVRLWATDTDSGQGLHWGEAVHETEPDKWARWFELVDSLLEPLERRSDEELRLPDAIAFQPARLSTFAKVRIDGEAADATVMDLRVFDASSPVAVRIGPTFRGAIMPITREEAPVGALWPDDE